MKAKVLKLPIIKKPSELALDNNKSKKGKEFLKALKTLASTDLSVEKEVKENLKQKLNLIYSVIPLAHKQFILYPGEKTANALTKLVAVSNELEKLLEQIAKERLIEEFQQILEELVKGIMIELANTASELVKKNKKIEAEMNYLLNKVAEASKVLLEEKSRRIQKIKLT